VQKSEGGQAGDRLQRRNGSFDAEPEMAGRRPRQRHCGWALHDWHIVDQPRPAEVRGGEHAGRCGDLSGNQR
jgi:hypothetical protein